MIRRLILGVTAAAVLLGVPAAASAATSDADARFIAPQIARF